jgi:hypothetical protein
MSNSTHCRIVWPKWAATFDNEGRAVNPAMNGSGPGVEDNLSDRSNESSTTQSTWGTIHTDSLLDFAEEEAAEAAAAASTSS